MAKQNPFLNADKLRAEAGADQVIPEGSFDQYEPATSYKLGTSAMAVDMTSGSWPTSPNGVVNTSRADDSFATQTYQPVGSSILYQRRWDQTPIDYSDDFNAASGSPFDHDKWAALTGTTTDPVHDSGYGGSMKTVKPPGATPYNGLISTWYLPGDFDITYIGFQSPNVPESGALLFGPKANINQTANPPGGNSVDVVVRAASNTQSGQWHARVGGSYITLSGSSYLNSPTYIRVTRVGTLLTFYWKTSEGASWTTGGSSQQPASFTGADIYLAFQPASGHASTTFNYYHGDITLNGFGTTTIALPESGLVAYWSDWSEIKNAADTLTESQSVADTAVSTHNDATSVHGFDLATFITANDATAVALEFNTGLTRNQVIYADQTSGLTEFDTTTTFTSITDVDVTMNGISLIPGIEYTDSGTSPGAAITLTAPTVNGDDIVVTVWKVQ